MFERYFERRPDLNMEANEVWRRMPTGNTVAPVVERVLPDAHMRDSSPRLSTLRFWRFDTSSGVLFGSSGVRFLQRAFLLFFGELDATLRAHEPSPTKALRPSALFVCARFSSCFLVTSRPHRSRLSFPRMRISARSSLRFRGEPSFSAHREAAHQKVAACFVWKYGGPPAHQAGRFADGHAPRALAWDGPSAFSGGHLHGVTNGRRRYYGDFFVCECLVVSLLPAKAGLLRLDRRDGAGWARVLVLEYIGGKLRVGASRDRSSVV